MRFYARGFQKGLLWSDANLEGCTGRGRLFTMLFEVERSCRVAFWGYLFQVSSLWSFWDKRQIGVVASL